MRERDTSGGVSEDVVEGMVEGEPQAGDESAASPAKKRASRKEDGTKPAKKKAKKKAKKATARAALLAPMVDDEAWREPPRTREEVGAWVLAHLGVRLAPGGPLEYVSHAFLAGVSEMDEAGDGRQATSREVQAQATHGPIDCVVWAHRGGGKTFLGAVATVLDLVFRPGIEVRILGGSMEQSKRMHACLRALLSQRVDESGAVREGPWQMVAKVGEKSIVMRNGARAELLAQSEKSVRGTRVQRLRCDEVDLFKGEVWEAAQLVTRSKRCGRFIVRASVECLSTMHNVGGVMERVVEECQRGTRTLFRWGIVQSLEKCDEAHACTSEAGDCPLLPECGGSAKHEEACGHVTIDDAISMKRRVALRTWKSEMLCDRPRREGLVLEEFDFGPHVVQGEPWAEGEASRRWVYGMDFGFRAPTVVLVGVVVAGREPHAGGGDVLYIVDEWVRERLVLGEHIRAISGGEQGGLGPWPRCEWIGVDPAGHATNDQTGKSAIAMLREAGLVVKTPRRSIEDGLNLLRARLLPADSGSAPRLFIHARCTHLLTSVQRYRYGEGSERHVALKDGNDHAVDALRYLVNGLERKGAGMRGY
jgi:hypothetical protein